jgi:anti-sigma B factor antagonist
VQIRDRLQGQVAVLELSGRFTVNDHPGLLKDAVADAVRRGTRDVVIDLSGVRYVDSTRLGELIAAHVTVARQGGRLKLAAVPARVFDLLRMAGLDAIFEHFPSVDEAVTSYGRN